VQTIWEPELKKDPLENIWDYALFYPKKGSKGTVTPVHLLPHNIYKGISLKIRDVFKHVEYCVENFGRENVFI
jgi:hypothetical protein